MNTTDTPGSSHDGPGVSAVDAERAELGFTLDEFGAHVTALGSALITGMRPVMEQLAIAARDLAAAFADTWRRATEALVAVVALSDAILATHVPTYAVRCLGISEADIRTWTLTEVRMWNHRRIAVDRDELLDWVLAARRRGEL